MISQKGFASAIILVILLILLIGFTIGASLCIKGGVLSPIGFMLCTIEEPIALVINPFVTANEKSKNQQVTQTLSQVTLTNLQEESLKVIEIPFGFAAGDLAGKSYKATELISAADLYIPKTTYYRIGSDFDNLLGDMVSKIDGNNVSSTNILTEGIHKVEFTFTNGYCPGTDLGLDYVEKSYSWSVAKPRNIRAVIWLEEPRNSAPPKEIIVQTKSYQGKDLFLHCTEYNRNLFQ